MMGKLNGGGGADTEPKETNLIEKLPSVSEEDEKLKEAALVIQLSQKQLSREHVREKSNLTSVKAIDEVQGKNTEKEPPIFVISRDLPH
jgi:hypothetical protein